jgi:hypothetical protein
VIAERRGVGQGQRAVDGVPSPRGIAAPLELQLPVYRTAILRQIEREPRCFRGDDMERVEAKRRGVAHIGDRRGRLVGHRGQTERGDHRRQRFRVGFVNYPERIRVPGFDAKQPGDPMEGLGAAHRRSRMTASAALPFSWARLIKSAKLRARNL